MYPQEYENQDLYNAYEIEIKHSKVQFWLIDRFILIWVSMHKFPQRGGTATECNCMELHLFINSRIHVNKYHLC